MRPARFIPARPNPLTTTSFRFQTLAFCISIFKNAENNFSPRPFFATAGEPGLVTSATCLPLPHRCNPNLQGVGWGCDAGAGHVELTAGAEFFQDGLSHLNGLSGLQTFYQSGIPSAGTRHLRLLADQRIPELACGQFRAAAFVRLRSALHEYQIESTYNHRVRADIGPAVLHRLQRLTGSAY